MTEELDGKKNQRTNNVVPPQVLSQAIAAREMRKRSRLLGTKTTPKAPTMEDPVFEQKCLTSAYEFVKLYRENNLALTDDYVTRLNTGGGILGVLTKMKGEIAMQEMLSTLYELRQHYKDPKKARGEIFEYVKRILADPENYSMIFKLAVFEAYIRKSKPRAMK